MSLTASNYCNLIKRLNRFRCPIIADTGSYVGNTTISTTFMDNLTTIMTVATWQLMTAPYAIAALHRQLWKVRIKYNV